MRRSGGSLGADQILYASEEFGFDSFARQGCGMDRHGVAEGGFEHQAVQVRLAAAEGDEFGEGAAQPVGRGRFRIGAHGPHLIRETGPGPAVPGRLAPGNTCASGDYALSWSARRGGR